MISRYFLHSRINGVSHITFDEELMIKFPTSITTFQLHSNFPTSVGSFKLRSVLSNFNRFFPTSLGFFQLRFALSNFSETFQLWTFQHLVLFNYTHPPKLSHNDPVWHVCIMDWIFGGTFSLARLIIFRNCCNNKMLFSHIVPLYLWFCLKWVLNPLKHRMTHHKAQHPETQRLL